MEQAKIRYGCLPEYLWSDLPDAAVLRRTDTKKWIAVLMKVPRCKFGLQGDVREEIAGLHADPLTIPNLIDGVNLFAGYHMNKKHWITLRLQGDCPPEQVLQLLSVSYSLAVK